MIGKMARKKSLEEAGLKTKRKFNGLVYKAHPGGSFSQSKARRKAKKLRLRGFHARVVRSRVGWNVFKRRKLR